jgi:hypothetical protein
MDNDATTPCEAIADTGGCMSRECPEDLNGDSHITADDLLALLAVFGRDRCDMNIVGSDGLINTADLLELLAQFGRYC